MTSLLGEVPTNHDFLDVAGGYGIIEVTPGRLAASNTLLVEYNEGPPLDWIPNRGDSEEMRRARVGLGRDAAEEQVQEREQRVRAFEDENWRRGRAAFLGLAPGTSRDVVSAADEREWEQRAIDRGILPTEPEWRDPRAANKYATNLDAAESALPL